MSSSGKRRVKMKPEPIEVVLFFASAVNDDPVIHGATCAGRGCKNMCVGNKHAGAHHLVVNLSAVPLGQRVLSQ